MAIVLYVLSFTEIGGAVMQLFSSDLTLTLDSNLHKFESSWWCWVCAMLTTYLQFNYIKVKFKKIKINNLIQFGVLRKGTTGKRLNGWIHTIWFVLVFEGMICLDTISFPNFKSMFSFLYKSSQFTKIWWKSVLLISIFLKFYDSSFSLFKWRPLHPQF